MNLPQLNAEASLAPTTGRYRGKALLGRLGTGEVTLQQFGASSLLGHHGVAMRCCGYSALLHRYVCITRTVPPAEQCACRQDYFGHPVIICRPPVLSTD